MRRPTRFGLRYLPNGIKKINYYWVNYLSGPKDKELRGKNKLLWDTYDIKDVVSLRNE